MRKQRIVWEYLVIAILLVMYGGFFAFRKNDNPAITYTAIAAFIIGLLMLAIYLVFYFIAKNKKKRESVENEAKADSVEVNKEEVAKENEKAEDANKPDNEVKEDSAKASEQAPEITVENEEIQRVTARRDYEYVPKRRYEELDETGYVKEVGYGPIIEVRRNILRDMRTNTYYRIEGSNVFIEGYSLIYRIERNRIKSINGGLLYEMYGGNINKVFGGYYASISGNYITKYDLSKKFELTSQFSNKIILLVAVLVFGDH